MLEKLFIFESEEVTADGDIGIFKEVIVVGTRGGTFQDQSGSDAGETVVMAALDLESIARIHDKCFAVAGHTDLSLHDEKSFEFFFMHVAGAGLTVETEKIFTAISALHFVDDPDFDQAGFHKIAEVKILDQRHGIGHGALPFFHLFTEICQILVDPGIWAVAALLS